MKKKAITSEIKAIVFSRVTLAFAFLAILLLAIFGVLFSVSRENVLSIGHLNAIQVSKTIEYYLIEEIDEIALASQTIQIMQDRGQSNEEILEYLTFESSIVTEAISGNYTGIYGYINGEYLDGTGWVPEEGYDPLSRPWYTAARDGNGKVVYVTPYIDSETGNLMLSVCKMLRDKKSVVSLDVSLDRIQEIVENDDYSSYERIYVTDRNNIVVASADKTDLCEDFSDTPLLTGYHELKRKLDGNGYYSYRDEKGDRYSVFISTVENQWNVFLVTKTDTLLSSLYGIYAILIVGIAAFIFFAFWMFNYLNKRRKMAENLNTQLESIADIYIAVYKLDIENNIMEEVRSLPYVRTRKRIAEETVDTAYEVLDNMMRLIVRKEYWSDMEAFIDSKTLDVRVGNSNSVSLEYLSNEGWSKARIVVLERKNDRITSFLWMMENIDEEKRKQSELRYLSETDLMTGLRNRGCGERLVKEQLESRTGGMFCLLDADKFKQINDNYGHNVGDNVIKAIARCMERSFVSPDIVFRLGGDEFAAFAIGIENESQSKVIFNRFLNELEHVEIPEFAGERTIQVSVGVSFAAAGAEIDFDTLYKEADNAVYDSKKTDGSCVSFFRRAE